MPAGYAMLHLLGAAVGILAVRGVRARPACRAALGLAAAALLLAGFAAERWPNPLLRWWPGGAAHLVFLTNWSLAAAAVLAALLWHAAGDRAARLRAALLAAPLLLLATWSYAGWFQQPPPHLSGQLDGDGRCPQSSEASCAPAAAVMLLHRHGITSDEATLARDCLCRARQGTSRLGLFRGLALQAHPHGLTPRLATPRTPIALCRLGQAALITVGLELTTPRAVARKMERYGWSVGSWHTLLVTGGDPDGRWLDVIDPAYGPERWPTGDLEALWDGTAVVLAGRVTIPHLKP